jgi:hypothetical protein
MVRNPALEAKGADSKTIYSLNQQRNNHIILINDPSSDEYWAVV